MLSLASELSPSGRPETPPAGKQNYFAFKKTIGLTPKGKDQIISFYLVLFGLVRPAF